MRLEPTLIAVILLAGCPRSICTASGCEDGPVICYDDTKDVCSDVSGDTCSLEYVRAPCLFDDCSQDPECAAETGL